MSRLLKLIPCVIVLSAIGGAAVSSASSASVPSRRATSMILCPVTATTSSSTIVPCCGPPLADPTIQPICCGPVEIRCCGTPLPANCPVMITALASKNPSSAGQKVTISGHWTSGTGGQTIDLWAKLPGAKSFKDVAQTHTDSSGNYSFVRHGVMTNRQWYTKAGSDQSATIAQQVKAKVTFSLAPSGYQGKVIPNHAGERVLFEQHGAHGWIVLSHPRLNGESGYRLVFHEHAPSDVRTVLPGDSRNVRSASRVFLPSS